MTCFLAPFQTLFYLREQTEHVNITTWGFRAERTLTHLEKLNHGVNTEGRRHTVCNKSLIELDERRGKRHEPKSCLLTRNHTFHSITCQIHRMEKLFDSSQLINCICYIYSYLLFCQIILLKATWSKAKYIVRIQPSIRSIAQKAQQWICYSAEIWM